jgi:hypothetical protein
MMDAKDNNGNDTAELIARKNRSICHVNGIANAAFTIDKLHGHDLDVLTLVDGLKKSINKARDGDTSEIEAILMAQAKTLDVFFHSTLRQIPGMSMGNQIQAFSDIALRAQSQCRKTLLALADIKHPKRTMFIRQQNNAITQQVNNEPNPSISEKTTNPANELLEIKPHDGWLDRGTSLETVTVNPEMETVGAVHRG